MSSSFRPAASKALGYHRIRDLRTAERIISSTGLAPPDYVIEFGAGDGQLSQAVSNRCRRLVCIETDRNLWRALKERFHGRTSVEPVLADFMAFQLPQRGPYKLVSNVPFGLTAALFRKLQAVPNPPVECYLIVQSEAAHKWVGIAHETAASVVLKTRFEARPVLALHRTAFTPRPNVDAMLVALSLRTRPLVPPAHLARFEAFVRREFARPISGAARKAGDSGFRAVHPGELDIVDWVELFRRSR